MIQEWIFHDSHHGLFRCPFGAVPCNSKLSLGIQITSDEQPEQVLLRLWKGDEERISMNLSEGVESRWMYKAEILLPSTPKLMWYYFIIVFKNRTYYYGNNEQQLGGIGQIYDHIPPAYQITVYREGATTPEWFKSSVMYQVFVDRFSAAPMAKSEAPSVPSHFLKREWFDSPAYIRDPESGRVLQYDFFGGNLLGLIEKLPYLKELGIQIIYLNPIFESSSNHKYDTGDYHKIDPMYGDEAIFLKLCSEGKKMGIHIILDGVFSHTGSNSLYFNREGTYPSLGAFQSTQSPYYSWYRFREHPHHYDCWWGIDTMPNVNETESSYQYFMLFQENSVLKHWMKLGVKGWRLDVADELPSSFIKNLRRVMKDSDPTAVLIGEVWEDASNKLSYGEVREYFLGDELDSVTNYPFRKNLLDFLLGHIDAEGLHFRLMQLYENYPIHHFYGVMNLIGSHDVPRILTLLGEAPPQELLSKSEQEAYSLSTTQRTLAIKRLKLLSLFQMSFPGVPCIYYGDEAGLEGYADPLNRRTYPWGKEEHELLDWYKTIVPLRNQLDHLQTGTWSTIYAQEDVYGMVRQIEKGEDVFEQEKKDGTSIVLFNRNPEKRAVIELNLDNWCRGALMDYFKNEEIHLNGTTRSLTLEPLEAKILMQR
ncbi:MAG: glycoside hydrolase family 13 protein [Thermotaleaceae bacterium]